MLWDDLRPPRDTDFSVQYADGAGVTWSLTEHRATPGDVRGARYLIAESENAIRRLWTYPPDWRDFGGDGLVALLAAPQPPTP
jgi:hypothetical protein